MAGETTLQAIAEWIRLRSIWLQDVLPDTRATFPCAATYSNVSLARRFSCPLRGRMVLLAALLRSVVFPLGVLLAVLAPATRN